MLVANRELRIGKDLREPGEPVPEAESWPPHVLDRHLRTGQIVDCDERRQKSIRAEFLGARATSEAKRIEKDRLRAQRELDEARRAVREHYRATEASRDRLAAAEKRLASIGKPAQPEAKPLVMTKAGLIDLQRDRETAAGPALLDVAESVGLRSLPGSMRKSEIVDAILKVHNARVAQQEAEELFRSLESTPEPEVDAALDDESLPTDPETSDTENAALPAPALPRPKELKSLRIDPVRDIAREYGLDATGSKLELMDRILDHEGWWRETGPQGKPVGRWLPPDENPVDAELGEFLPDDDTPPDDDGDADGDPPDDDLPPTLDEGDAPPLET